MSREEEIKKQRERMQRRFEDRNTPEGGSKSNYIDFNKMGGYKKELYYKLKEGINNMDILPYKVKTKNHIDKLSVGDTDYVLEVWVHKNIVGPNNGSCICLEKMYGQPCPICDERRQREKDSEEDPEELNKLYPQHRVLYNVLDLDAKGEPEIQILDMSYKKFEKPLRTQAGINGEVTIFHDPAIGKTIQVRGEPESFYSKQLKKMVPFVSPSRFDFIERTKPYQSDIADYTYSLDEILVVPTSEEIHSLYYGYDTNSIESNTDNNQHSVMNHTAKEEPKKVNPFANRAKLQTDNQSNEATEQIHKERRFRPEPEKNNPECPFELTFGYDCGQKKECRDCDNETFKLCDKEAIRLEKENA